MTEKIPKVKAQKKYLSEKAKEVPEEIKGTTTQEIVKDTIVFSEAFGDGTVMRKNKDNTFAINFGGSVRDLPTTSFTVKEDT